MLQEYCRNTSGIPQEYNRNAAEIMDEYCGNTAGVLQKYWMCIVGIAVMLQEMLQERKAAGIL